VFLADGRFVPLPAQTQPLVAEGFGAVCSTFSFASGRSRKRCVNRQPPIFSFEVVGRFAR